MSELSFGYFCPVCEFNGDVVATLHDYHTLTFDCPECGDEQSKDYDPMDFYEEDYDRDR